MMNRYLTLFFSIPKTIYFNLRCFDLRVAIKFPVIVSYRVHLKGIRKGIIVINTDSVKTGMIRFGISDGSYQKGRGGESSLAFAENARMILHGGAIIANRFAINLCNNSTLILGEDFSSNYNLTISCGKKIKFGSHCMLGWDCTFIDGDGHLLMSMSGDKVLNEPDEIVIGDHVWIASETAFLKGSKIGNNNVIGFRSTVLNEVKGENCVISGTPARVIRTNINWVR